jgi:hypothetical protein
MFIKDAIAMFIALVSILFTLGWIIYMVLTYGWLVLPILAIGLAFVVVANWAFKTVLGV